MPLLRWAAGDAAGARIVRIKYTLEIGEIEVSTSLLDDVRRQPHLEVHGEPARFPFDAAELVVRVASCDFAGIGSALDAGESRQ